MLSPCCKVLLSTMTEGLERSPSIQSDLFSSLSYRRLELLCVVMEMVVNSNSGRGGGQEWMGPGYQGSTVSLGLIKFSATMHLSGVQVENIGGAEPKIIAERSRSCAQNSKISASDHEISTVIVISFLFLQGRSQPSPPICEGDTTESSLHLSFSFVYLSLSVGRRKQHPLSVVCVGHRISWLKAQWSATNPALHLHLLYCKWPGCCLLGVSALCDEFCVIENPSS